MFSVVYSSQARKFLKKADKIVARRIIAKIEKLLEDPLTPDTKAIEGTKGLFRVRVGDYRILYDVNFANSVVGIVKIDKRSQAYR